MITDALVNFVAPGAPLSLVGGAGVAFPSNVYDELGQGVGTAPAVIIGTRSTFGSDMGLGQLKAQVEAVVGVAAVAVGGSTLNVAFQGAPDLGAGGNYQPGTWQTLVETGPLTAAQLTAQQLIARFDFPPAFPPGTLPRYLLLLFSPSAGGSCSPGRMAV